MVECPICNVKFKTEQAVSVHLDNNNCGSPTAATKRPPTQETIAGPSTPISKLISKPVVKPDRLPVINFSMIKETQLQKKLAGVGLNSGGSKELIVKRWTEWTLLVNSNWDNDKNPKSAAELKKQMDIWEKTQGGRTPMMTAVQRESAQIKDKDFDAKAWSAKHDDSYNSLIANARRTAKKTKDVIDKKIEDVNDPVSMLPPSIPMTPSIPSIRTGTEAIPLSMDHTPLPSLSSNQSPESYSYPQQEKQYSLSHLSNPDDYNLPPSSQIYNEQAEGNN
jgi:E3 ubiquitin-protein ligase RAD18